MRPGEAGYGAEETVIVTAEENPPLAGQERTAHLEMVDATGRLLDMYNRWAQRSGLDARYCACPWGQRVLRIRGPGLLRHLGSEEGVHELTEAASRTKRGPDGSKPVSWVRVDIMAEAPYGNPLIDPHEVRFTERRWNNEGGPASPRLYGVYVTHLPTGITVICMDRPKALNLLRARLAHQPGRSPDALVRSYLLGGSRPRVHDVRTGSNASDARRVLDGDIDGFLAS